MIRILDQAEDLSKQPFSGENNDDRGEEDTDNHDQNDFLESDRQDGLPVSVVVNGSEADENPLVPGHAHFLERQSPVMEESLVLLPRQFL